MKITPFEPLAGALALPVGFARHLLHLLHLFHLSKL